MKLSVIIIKNKYNKTRAIKYLAALYYKIKRFTILFLKLKGCKGFCKLFPLSKYTTLLTFLHLRFNC